MIEHVPMATVVTVTPDTVQTAGVFEAKPTVSPELEVALSANGATPRDTLPGTPKEMNCGAGTTVKLWITGLAAGTFALPGWVAVMEQVPAATMVNVFPDTVQTEPVVDAKLTGSPELAVALNASGAVPKATLPRGAKVMLCATVAILNVWVTGVAAE